MAKIKSLEDLMKIKDDAVKKFEIERNRKKRKNSCSNGNLRNSGGRKRYLQSGC